MSAPTLELAPEARAREFPITAEYTYLNTATQGPISSSTCRAIERALAFAQFPETPRGQSIQPTADLARARLAGLLGVGADDIVFTPNTTHGLNVCAHGIAWRPGDNVVLPEREFPSLAHAWQHLRAQGVEVRCVPWQGAGPTSADLLAAADARTRVISCSAVTWDTGYMIDLERLGQGCARAGHLLVVDGIQAVGAIEVDPRALGIAALSFHGYKWLLAGFGTGALYVSPEAIDQIQPRFVGEHSFAGGELPGDEPPPFQPGARRYATGGGNALGMAALAASLELIERLSLAAIGAHNRALAQQLVDGLGRMRGVRLVSPADPALRAAIVVFTLGERARDEALVRQLEELGIVVALRPRGVRVAPHLYNQPAEIDRLLAAVRAEAGR
jgi:selenocysteine lyase/cysteine desulfurase